MLNIHRNLNSQFAKEKKMKENACSKDKGTPYLYSFLLGWFQKVFLYLQFIYKSIPSTEKEMRYEFQT